MPLPYRWNVSLHQPDGGCPNKALHLTAIPLRSIAAGELYRSAIDE